MVLNQLPAVGLGHSMGPIVHTEQIKYVPGVSLESGTTYHESTEGQGWTA